MRVLAYIIIRECEGNCSSIGTTNTFSDSVDVVAMVKVTEVADIGLWLVYVFMHTYVYVSVSCVYMCKYVFRCVCVYMCVHVLL